MSRFGENPSCLQWIDLMSRWFSAFIYYHLITRVELSKWLERDSAKQVVGKYETFLKSWDIFRKFLQSPSDSKHF